jgi:hypothetical protein
LFIAAFDVVYGWTRMIHPEPEVVHGEQYRLLSQIFPVDSPAASMTIWGMLWWFTAVVCAINAFRASDRWGYGAAIGIKVSWLIGNAWAWANGLDGGGGVIALWVFVLAIVIRIARVPEPVPALDRWADRVHDETGEIPRANGGTHDPQ